MTEPVAPNEKESGEKDTQPLPRSSEFEPAPRKRKSQRWVGWTIVIVILVGLGFAAWIIGDNMARDYAATNIRERIVQLFNLPSDEGVTVDIGEGSVLLQAIRGGLEEVRVTVDEVSFGELTGALEITGTEVPLDTSQPLEQLRANFAIPEANVEKIGGYLSGSELASITLVEPEITVASEFSVFGLFSIPVSLGLTPAAVDGQLSFEPTTVILGEDSISVDDLRNGEFGGLADAFLSTQSFCVAQYLPQALTVTEAKVVDKDFVVSIEGDGTALSDPALKTLGTCPQ